jgi:hypothetical protein
MVKTLVPQFVDRFFREFDPDHRALLARPRTKAMPRAMRPALPSPGIAIFALPGENSFGLPSGRNLLPLNALQPPADDPSVRQFRFLVLDADVADG